MNCFNNLKDIKFDPKEYNPHQWFIEQDEFNICPIDDEPIDIPVFIISEYTLAHYKHSINICCEKNLEEFYDCLGTQPLKIVFSHSIDDDYVKRHGYNIYPDTNLNREYKINNNELYLDSNEVQLEERLGRNYDSDGNTTDEEEFELDIKKGYDSDNTTDEETEEEINYDSDNTDEQEEIDVNTENLEELNLS